jgi:hypothetical protein
VNPQAIPDQVDEREREVKRWRKPRPRDRVQEIERDLISIVR